ncbi:hypothetical protein IWW38_002227 [Coemansia aciculifera]|uniref:Uncharacterized protein n=1 Tax=Coemansia aciculifera TaxID=417176 RepID=A0ACC1M4M1_9FUNG|nr:hypothetical protein IWW38_002227 [Coemansia aciculifera]
MDPQGLPRAVTYRHMSQSQSLALNDLRVATAQLDTSYNGIFLLTASEYWLLLPLFNPVVIFWNTRHYGRLCRAADLTPSARRQMVANLVWTSLLGFIPIVNIIFSRRFKCNMRNLAIVEAQLLASEGKTRYSKEADSETAPLPAHVERLFNKCQVFKREDTMPADANRMSTVSMNSTKSLGSAACSVYSSPRVSMSEWLRDAETSTTVSVHSGCTDDATSTVIDLSDDCRDLALQTPVSVATTKDGVSLEKGGFEACTLEEEPQEHPPGWLYTPVAYVSSWFWGTAH